MNWGRIAIAGIAAGIVMNLADFVMHGFLLAATYTRYPVFTQTEANPMWFFLISICIGLAAACLFAKTRNCWSAGVSGGVTFGLFLGLVAFFQPFYNPLVLEGFPYYLSWCWGGTNLIDALVGGVALGALYKN